ncbi:hypothetical protein [Candidatus Palauibacter sp.]|uniref:hypothetical protein n=1 Tax=Candidatus Palauibacter sp. TaxID=3101350 RepID=UPI003AF1EF30
MKLAGIGSVLLAWAAWGLAPGPPGQSAVDLEATVDVTSVRVGEPFTIRLVVAQERTGEVRFPALMNVPESLEQTGPVRIRSADDGRRWEAEYTLVAWRADTLALPPIEVELAGAGGVIRSLQPPAVPVLSVLPEADDPLELREARPFLSLRGFPWWLLALAAALAGLAWWTWGRRRVAPSAAEGPAPPADIALREFERLRKVWIERRVTGDRLYDGYEATLRRYARSTRGWKPSRELLGLGDQDSVLIAALRHSVLARFARLRTDRDSPLDDLDVGEAFVRSEMPVAPPPESEEVAE